MLLRICTFKGLPTLEPEKNFVTKVASLTTPQCVLQKIEVLLKRLDKSLWAIYNCSMNIKSKTDCAGLTVSTQACLDAPWSCGKHKGALNSSWRILPYSFSVKSHLTRLKAFALFSAFNVSKLNKRGGGSVPHPLNPATATPFFSLRSS